MLEIIRVRMVNADSLFYKIQDRRWCHSKPVLITAHICGRFPAFCYCNEIVCNKGQSDARSTRYWMHVFRWRAPGERIMLLWKSGSRMRSWGHACNVDKRNAYYFVICKIDVVLSFRIWGAIWSRSSSRWVKRFMGFTKHARTELEFMIQ